MSFKTSCKRTKTDAAKGHAFSTCLWIRRFWIIGFSVTVVYFLVIYLLPLSRVIGTPIVPFKLAIELVICIIPIFTSIVLARQEIVQIETSISFENEVLIVNKGALITGICCLEIVSVSGSVISDDDGHVKYNTSMLLAIRVGMHKSVKIAFEAGVSKGEPYLRIFIAVTGNELNNIKEVLRREATRAEAILLASLNAVELRILENNDLMQAVGLLSGDLIPDFGTVDDTNETKTLIFLKGSPRVNPSVETSQIGTFISTALKQDYSVSLTCVFSVAKPGRERQKLEGRWKTIQSKEKRKEETLRDHAEKKKLITQYEEIQDNVGWFDSSVYFVVKASESEDINVLQEGVSGLIQSIWGGDNKIKLVSQTISKRNAFRLLTREHMKKQRVHVSSLASFVNTPIRKLPIISPELAPIFPVPPRNMVSNELVIGDSIFDGKPYSSVGLKIEWLREHVAVLGATGTGKTTLVKHLITQLSKKTSVPWWIFDIKGSEYAGLIGHIDGEVIILKPGLDPKFVISLMNPDTSNDESSAYSTFIILRELLKERGESSELSPAMEKLLRESVIKLASSLDNSNSIQSLIEMIVKQTTDDRMGKMTSDALLNRLQILNQEPLGSILRGGSSAINISELLDKRVILDLSYVSRIGGMESTRILYNLIAKHIFESAMKRGIVPGIHHVVVLEEASNLVPESYSRHSSADVTTGESMVMLQRATGQGVIVVSTRPNISSNILANTSTKITFRLPYDSQIGGKFLSLEDNQEVYLRGLKRGRALIAIPNTDTFEIATKPFVDMPPISSDASHQIPKEERRETDPKDEIIEFEKQKTRALEDEAKTVIFDRVGRFGNHIVAFLASKGMSTEQEIRELLSTIDSSVMEDDISEVIRNLISLGTIERESLALVPGGFLYTLPDRGLEAIRTVIVQYIFDRLEIEENEALRKMHHPNWPDIIIEDKAVVIIPDHLRASSMESTLDKIRQHMGILGNGINELFIVVRGSVAAAKLRELLDSSEDYNAVTVISAFPSSLDSMIENIGGNTQSPDEKITDSEPLTDTENKEDTGLIGAMHEIGPATSRAIQIRLWFGLIQDFVDLSNGQVGWDVLLDFIETTALQSLKGRSAPLTVEEGRRALTELLADEVLIAVRTNEDSKFIDVKQGLWIVNSTVLQTFRENAIGVIEGELRKHHSNVTRSHGYYDLCAGNTSYVVFPNQQQLSTLLNLHSDVACRTCKSTQVICILTASEYLEDNMVTPGNLIVKTMDDSLSALVS
ncbi:MAG: DUF853 family protein [Candidatus Thorarchaeota archaeon]|nr:DUF853 family protein [Candidatus Thorarchaeota archaeon]